MLFLEKCFFENTYTGFFIVRYSILSRGNPIEYYIIINGTNGNLHQINSKSSNIDMPDVVQSIN